MCARARTLPVCEQTRRKNVNNLSLDRVGATGGSVAMTGSCDLSRRKSRTVLESKKNAAALSPLDTHAHEPMGVNGLWVWAHTHTHTRRVITQDDSHAGRASLYHVVSRLARFSVITFNTWAFRFVYQLQNVSYSTFTRNERFCFQV